MGKAPAFQFYVKDWLTDTQLRLASPSTRGIWIDMLCFMWEAPERGEISGEKGKLAMMVGAENGEMDRFIEEANVLRFCDISVTHALLVTVRNRRMYREAKDRENNRLRQERHRRKRQSNREITPPSPSPSPNKDSKESFGTTNVPLCPHQEIIDLYHEILPTLPKVKTWTNERQQSLRARWREDPKRQNIEWWEGYFRHVGKSQFLMDIEKNRWLNLEWLVTKSHFVNVLEGKYH